MLRKKLLRSASQYQDHLGSGRPQEDRHQPMHWRKHTIDAIALTVSMIVPLQLAIVPLTVH
jgi:hypothetical protein